MARQFTLKSLLVWVLLATIPLAIAGSWIRSLGEGARAVDRARTKVERLGGKFRVGPSSGSYYVSLENCPLTDTDLADLSIDLRALPTRQSEDDERNVNLRLAGTRVSDAGLAALIGIDFGLLALPPQTTDAAIDTLKKLSLRGVLVIGGTQISDAGCVELGSAFHPTSIARDFPGWKRDRERESLPAH